MRPERIAVASLSISWTWLMSLAWCTETFWSTSPVDAL